MPFICARLDGFLTDDGGVVPMPEAVDQEHHADHLRSDRQDDVDCGRAGARREAAREARVWRADARTE